MRVKSWVRRAASRPDSFLAPIALYLSWCGTGTPTWQPRRGNPVVEDWRNCFRCAGRFQSQPQLQEWLISNQELTCKLLFVSAESSLASMSKDQDSGKEFPCKKGSPFLRGAAH